MPKSNHYRQCNWITDNQGHIEIHYHGAGESLGPEIRSRVFPSIEEKIEAFCLGRGITKSDFSRDYMELGPAYYDLIPILKDHAEFLIPFLKDPEALSLLKSLAKKLSSVCRADIAKE